MKRPNALSQSVQFDGNASGFDKTALFALDNTQIDACDVATTSRVPWMQTNSATVPAYYNELNISLPVAATLTNANAITMGIFAKGNEDKEGMLYAVEGQVSVYVAAANLNPEVQFVFGRTANSTLLVAHNAPENELDDFRLLPYRTSSVISAAVNQVITASCREIVLVRTARGAGGTGIAYHPIGFGVRITNYTGNTVGVEMVGSLTIQRFERSNRMFQSV